MTAPSNPAEVGALNRRGPDFAFPMEDAPKDGTILRLLVKFDRKSSAGAFEDTTEPSWTIGANNKDNTGEDQWDIVGWSWEQDVFCHAYGATAMGWLPFHTESNEPSALVAPSPPIGDTGGVGEDGELDAGINYAIERLCEILDVDPKSISWDAATETMDGDVMSVLCNVLRAAYGEDWSTKPEDTDRIRAALVPARVEAVDHIADAGKMVEPRVSDTGWLIECKPSVSRTPQWFHLEEEWVTDASKALRFARKQDAEAFIEHTGWTETFASEHMWSDPK